MAFSRIAVRAATPSRPRHCTSRDHPCAASHVPVADSAHLIRPQAEARGGQPCILVVDDDPLSRSLQARMVGLLGYGARTAAHAAEALECALEDRADVMLLDLGMPDVDGFSLLQQLRAAEARLARPPLPVIAVTGYAATVDRMRCLMAGFNDHVAKPVEAAALAAALARNLPGVDQPAQSSDAARVEAAARRLAQVKPADARFAPTVLETFAMRSGQLIDQISDATRRGESAALGQAVKALRASAQFMGARGMAALCDRLQAATAAGDFARAAALVASLAEEHQSVLVVLLRGARPAAPR